MTATIKLDRREFNAAIKAYSKESRKDWSDIVNGKLADLLFKAGKEAPLASGTKIRALKNDRTFMLMVTKIIRREFPSGLSRARFTELHKQLSRKIINARASATSYSRSGFYKAANRVKNPPGARPGREPKRRGKSFSSSLSTRVRRAIPAFGAKASAEILWAAQDNKDAAGKERVADKALRRGISVVVADMEKYLQKKAQARARKHSA